MREGGVSRKKRGGRGLINKFRPMRIFQSRAHAFKKKEGYQQSKLHSRV